jgi:hypothetical protein
MFLSVVQLPALDTMTFQTIGERCKRCLWILLTPLCPLPEYMSNESLL